MTTEIVSTVRNMIIVITKVTAIVRGTKAEVDLEIDIIKGDPDLEIEKEVLETTDHAVGVTAEAGEGQEVGVDLEKEVDTVETEVEVKVRLVTCPSHALLL